MFEVSLFLGEKQSGATVAGYGCPITTSSGCGAVGSASGLGPEGRTFESCYPDKKLKE